MTRIFPDLAMYILRNDFHLDRVAACFKKQKMTHFCPNWLPGRFPSIPQELSGLVRRRLNTRLGSYFCMVRTTRQTGKGKKGNPQNFTAICKMLEGGFFLCAYEHLILQLASASAISVPNPHSSRSRSRPKLAVNPSTGSTIRMGLKLPIAECVFAPKKGCVFWNGLAFADSGKAIFYNTFLMLERRERHSEFNIYLQRNIFEVSWTFFFAELFDKELLWTYY